MTTQLDYKTQERLKLHEGLVLSIYDDPKLGANYPTIFYGHLCTPSDPWEPGITYTEEDAEEVFQIDYSIAKEAAEKFVGDVVVPDDVMSVLIEVAYNCGETRLNTFVKMKAAIQDNDYILASQELEDSKLYRMLTKRYQPLVEMMRDA
jgi:GH24 family phage-related lysozyme (muramidase)